MKPFRILAIPQASPSTSKTVPEWVTVEVKVSKQAIKEAYKGTDILPAGVSEVSRQSLIIR